MPIFGSNRAKLNIRPSPPTPTEFPHLQNVVRAYSRWESGRFPIGAVRIGLSAFKMRKVSDFAVGLPASSPYIRDAAMIINFPSCSASVPLLY